MTNTIGNPLSWGARVLGLAGHDLAEVAQELGGRTQVAPIIQRIGPADLRAALRLGFADFGALRTDVIVIGLLYPIVGTVLIYAAIHSNILPLVFPLLAGFMLVGPAAAVGLYEMSRRREAGLAVSWADGLAVIRSPRIGVIAVLAVALFMVFFMWMVTAHLIFQVTMGPDLPASLGGFLGDVLGTRAGWAMMAIGIPVGFVFAAVTLAVSVVAFPLLIDRPVGLPVAVLTSLRVTAKNPDTVALWGLIIAVAMVLGTLPILLGLAGVLPVLGHASWHLYRRVVAFR